MVAVGAAIGGSIGIVYGFHKDMFLHFKRKRHDQKNLDDNFRELKSQMDILSAMKRDTEEKAENETTMEINELGKSLLPQIEEKEKVFEMLNVRYQNARKTKDKFQNLHCGNQDDHTSEECNGLATKCQDIPESEENFSHLVKGKEHVLKHQGYSWLHLSRDAKLSKELVKRRGDVVNLISQMRQGDLWTTKKIEKVEMKHGDNIDDVPSLNENVEKLLEHLRDNDARKIGIWGPPGVGKTTILKNLNDRFGRPSLSPTNPVFDIVIWVDVPKNVAVKHIQQQILERLRQTMRETNTTENLADHISRTLDRKKYLLILDQVSSKIDLSELGIRNNHRNGKVVIACRDQSICRNMNMDKKIHVKRLSYLDAWSLFKKLVGDVIDYPPIKKISEDIVEKLGGLPQVIQFVASSLKNESDEGIWRDMLRTLQSHDAFQCQGLAATGVYNAYKWVYDRLPYHVKECFRYGALFPEDYEIKKDYIIECWIAERFIRGIHLGGPPRYHQQYRAARDKGQQILRDLTDACLLECCPREGYIKMPVILRNMALFLRSRSLLVRAGEEIDTHPKEDEWRNATSISLMGNELRTLPERPKCCNISTLFLQRNAQLTTIPNSFFAHMCELRILDLQHTGIQSLPSSISNLINLRSLYLSNCRHLTTLPAEIVKLQRLEVLDIQGSGFFSLPVEIAHLVGLRCLRASFVYDAFNPRNERYIDSGCRSYWSSRVIVPPSIFDNLHRLEELTILVDPKEDTWNDNVQQVAKKIASLSAITSLCFYFPTVNSFETFITSRRSMLETTQRRKNNFCAFQILIGDREAHHPYALSAGGSGQRYFKCSGAQDISPSVKEVLKQATVFELIDHPSLECLSDIGTENMESLKVCAIQECNKMRCISKGNLTGGAAFRFLKKLHIMNLQHLSCILEGPVKPGSFCRLTTLTLNGCPALTTILTPGIAHQLSQLRHLRVENCFQLLSIIEPEVAKQSGTLGKLKILQLSDLPQLLSICQSDSLDWLELEKIEIKECRLLRNLSLSTINAQQLKEIRCEDDWWREVELQAGLRKHLNRICRFPDGTAAFENGARSATESLSDLHSSYSEPSFEPTGDESFRRCLPFFTKKWGWQRLK